VHGVTSYLSGDKKPKVNANMSGAAEFKNYYQRNDSAEPG
jgi:hypothetical protein